MDLPRFSSGPVKANCGSCLVFRFAKFSHLTGASKTCMGRPTPHPRSRAWASRERAPRKATKLRKAAEHDGKMSWKTFFASSPGRKRLRRPQSTRLLSADPRSAAPRAGRAPHPTARLPRWATPRRSPRTSLNRRHNGILGPRMDARHPWHHCTSYVVCLSYLRQK